MKTPLIILIALAAFAALVGVSVAQFSSPSSSPEATIYASYDRANISDLAKEIDKDALEPHKVQPASEANGEIADHTLGDASKAKVVIYEFADFQCSHCAEWNPIATSLVKESGGRVALVFRAYPLSYNTNAVMVASAVEAAALQGYWAEYKDYVFENQDDWYYSKHDKLSSQLEKYFAAVTDGNVDLAKFRSDMQSEAVAKRLAMNMALAQKVELQGTPAFYIDGEFVKPSDLRTTVEKKLKN